MMERRASLPLFFYLYINNNSLVILNWNQWKAVVTFCLNLKISVELQSAYIGISLLADFKLLQGKPFCWVAPGYLRISGKHWRVKTWNLAPDEVSIVSEQGKVCLKFGRTRERGESITWWAWNIAQIEVPSVGSVLSCDYICLVRLVEGVPVLSVHPKESLHVGSLKPHINWVNTLNSCTRSVHQ